MVGGHFPFSNVTGEYFARRSTVVRKSSFPYRPPARTQSSPYQPLTSPFCQSSPATMNSGLAMSLGPQSVNTQATGTVCLRLRPRTDGFAPSYA